MKKMCYAIMLSLSFPTYVLANEMGIGFTINGNSRMLHLPIRVSENLMVEPFLGIDTSHQELSNSTIGDSTANSKSYTAGLGLFNFSSADESTDVYLGARLMYSRHKNENSTPYSFSNGKGYSYTIAPTFGFEYHISRSVTLGAEAAYIYTRSSDEDNYSTGQVYTSHDTFQGTRSALIIRYYFQ